MSTADFNDDANFDVKIVVNHRSGGSVSCLPGGGTTGEDSNLFFIGGGCRPKSSNARLPTFTFNQRGKDSHLGQVGQWCNDDSQCAAPSQCAIAEWGDPYDTCIPCEHETYGVFHYSTCMKKGYQCESNAMCDGDLYCDDGLYEMGGSKTCKERIPYGQKCDHNFQCLNPHSTDSHSVDGWCAKAEYDAGHETCIRCRSEVWDGSDYSTCMVEGAKCHSSAMCGDGLYCDNGLLDATVGTCKRPLEYGERCEHHFQCPNPHSTADHIIKGWCAKADASHHYDSCLTCPWETWGTEQYSTCMVRGAQCHGDGAMCESGRCEDEHFWDDSYCQ